jgi:hypothetical protein
MGSAPAATRSLDELEVLWRDRLQVARLELNTAVAHRYAVLSELENGKLPTGGILEALRRSELSEQVARDHFGSVLNAFTRLILDGRVPE